MEMDKLEDFAEKLKSALEQKYLKTNYVIEKDRLGDYVQVVLPDEKIKAKFHARLIDEILERKTVIPENQPMTVSDIAETLSSFIKLEVEKRLIDQPDCTSSRDDLVTEVINEKK